MDAFFDYNWIQMAYKDEEKITFTIDQDFFCYRIMHFRLKNRVTYQRLVNKIFKD